MTIDCHVLDDGRRMLSQVGISRAIGIRGNTTFSEHFGRLSSKVEGLTVSASVEFTLRNGGVVLGRPATDLVTICGAYQDAFLAGGGAVSDETKKPGPSEIMLRVDVEGHTFYEGTPQVSAILNCGRFGDEFGPKNLTSRSEPQQVLDDNGIFYRAR